MAFQLRLTPLKCNESFYLTMLCTKFDTSFQVNKTLPFLVANVIEILDVDPEDLGGGEVDGANVDLDSQRKGQCAVIKTSTRQTYFLPGTTLYA